MFPVPWQPKKIYRIKICTPNKIFEEKNGYINKSQVLCYLCSTSLAFVIYQRKFINQQ